MFTKITENLSKQFRLASAFVIICLFVVKAAAYQDDYYIVQNNSGEYVLDVAANDNTTCANNLRTLNPTTDNGNLTFAFNGRITFSLNNPNFVGFDTFEYDYLGCGFPPYPPAKRVWILVIQNSDNATDAGEGWCRDSVGQPVNVMNGNMWLKQQDYLLPGLGESIDVTRFYNSITQANGLFGLGWTSQYDEDLTTNLGNNLLRLRSAGGRTVYFGRRFTTEPFTSFSSAVTGSIVKEPDLSYTLTYKDGRKRSFSPTGRLMWQRDRNGNQTTLNYTSGVLTGITDAAGRVLSILSNANGTIAKICDGTGANPCLPGEIASYTYITGTTRLQTVNYIDGSKYDFEYDTTTAPGKVLLKTVKDALNNIVETHVYDNQGRATTSERHDGAEKYTLTYNQTDPTYGAFTSVTHRQQPTDPLIESKYFFTRQSATNLITRIDGSCACGAGGQVTTFEYDTNLSWLNLKKTTDALGRQMTYSYDNNRNVTQIMDVWGTQKFTYNSFGEVLTYKDRVHSQNPDPNVNTVVNTYNSTGDLLTTKDALGFITTLAYPTTNNRGLPDQITDARGKVTKFKWFPTSGLLQEVEDPHGKKTNFTYDARARIDMITNALGHVTGHNYFDDTQRKVEMIYPNSDKITYKFDARRLPESMTDERGKITNYEFDPQYRLKKITDPLGHVREFDYDDMSNMKLYKDPLGNITDYRYDAFDRLKEIEYPAASVGATRLKEKFEYDTVGRIKKHFDDVTNVNRFTEYTYDDVTRKITITNAELEATELKYNQRLQMIEVKDALLPTPQVYTFAYDPLGRMLSQTRAGGTMSFEYDEVGNRKKRIDYMGRVTNYAYDNLNRLTQIAYGDGSPPKQYGYDDISRLTSATNEMGTVTIAQDSRNRLLNTTDVFGKVIVYEYERTPMVNQKRLKLDGALYATYNFDDAERLENIVNASDSTTISFGYHADDLPMTRTYPNGVSTSYEFDNMRRLKRLTDNGPSGTLFDRQYGYSTANQISQITELTGTRMFGYDNVNRLTGVTGSVTESYLFDNVGNRTSSHRASSYGYQSGQFNRLTSAVTPSQTVTYGYDANGNTVSKSEGKEFWRYNWDNENRMTEAATRKQRVRYKYDALGRRVSRNFGYGKESTKFTYDGDDVLVDDNFGTQTKYLNGEGIDNKLRQTVGSTTNYFLADHLGSTNGLTNSSGGLTASNSYDSFGNTTNTSFPSRYQFTGREFDNFTGLQFSRARFYDPNLGRFISEDPIGFNGGDVNLYGYVRNKPISYFDPYGLDEYSMMERLGKPRPPRPLNEALDELQIQLGILGMIPGVGEPFDAVDGTISLFRGDYTGAALSGGSVIPFVGWGAGITKVCKRANDLGPGVYKIGVSGTDYIGQSVEIGGRSASHFTTGGKFSSLQNTGGEFFSMPGSSRLEREVYEQYLINNARIDNLRNVRNPMGGRSDIFKQMFDPTIRKYNLPR